jgi:hypothetical protein
VGCGLVADVRTAGAEDAGAEEGGTEEALAGGDQEDAGDEVAAPPVVPEGP